MGSCLAFAHRIFLPSLLTVLLVPSSLVAAVKKTPTIREIHALKAEVSQKSKKLDQLKKTMSQLEKELGERNQKLVKLFDIKRELDSQMQTFSAEIMTKREAVDVQKSHVQRILKNAILSHMSGAIDPAALLSRKYLLEGLKKKNDLLVSSSDRLLKLSKNLGQLRVRFEEYQKVEGELANLLNDLESDKNMKASEYVATLNEKKEKEGMLSQYQALFLSDKKGAAVRKKVGMMFKAPVDRYSSIKYKDKGVTFLNSQDKVIDVKATGDGKVVYSGDLSNYGNVVMIDHGNETRSILLGKFSSVVKKGDDVKSGAVVAKTLKSSKGGQGKLYFEVRIKNQIQNTVLLLDELATMQNIAASDTL